MRQKEEAGHTRLHLVCAGADLATSASMTPFHTAVNASWFSFE